MTTDKEELFECVIPLPDALIRKPMDEQVKSVKHGDHDQSDHGNWATGGSAGAGDTKDNPIRTSDVEEAARALGEGKHVQLSSPDQVATLLDRLNELAKEAEAAGSKAKNIDLCNVTVPGTNLFCVESKGIPRVEMPQLKGIPNAGSAASDLEADKRGEVDITEAYLEQLRSSGVTLDEDDALASHLKATQNELNGNKVAGIMSAARAGELDLNQPIVVSRDGYIVDGHHRWAAKVALEHDGIDDPETDMKIPVVRVDQDILEILESSKQFAADMGLPQVAVKSIKHADHDQSEHGNWATGNTEKTGPQAWLGITKLSDVPKYKIGSPSEASEPQVAARIAENIAEFKAAGGVVTRLPILPNAGVTGPYSYAETPEQEATSAWLFREAESARASADEYELRAEAASSQEEQDKLLSIASGYSHMATALDRASGSGTFIATTGGERGTIVGVLAGSFNSVEWEGTMFGSSQSVAGTGSALMYAAIEAVADADRVTRVGITFPEPESLPFYRAFGFTPEVGTWESKPNPASVILSRGSAVRIDQAVSGMTPESIVAQYGLTKSLKHGDHDQSDHGNWAHGNAAVPELSKPDKKEAEKYLEERYPPDDPNRDSDLGKKLGLTSLEWAAADHYRTQGYMEINNLLRGKGSDWGMEYAPADIRSVQLLDEAMDKSTIKNFETVYRGTSMLASKMDTFLSGLEVGGVYTDPSFTSTSRGEDIAESFATNRHPDTEREERANVMWEIVLPPGTSALDMQSLFPNFGSNEEEVLLDRDTHLRILSKESAGVSLDGEPVYRVKAIAIPTTTKSLKHADHDQSDHGNWADGSVPLAKTPIVQVDALRSWSSNSYNMINGALRNSDTLGAQERGGLREPVQKMQDGLDKLFAGVPPTTRPWTLYRGATGEFVTDIVKQYEAMIAKGEEEYRATGKPPTSFVLPRFTDKGFVSTTPDKDVAMHFTGSGFQGGPFYTGDGRAMFEINLPEGSKMVNVEEYVNEFGGFAKFAAEESEFLLPRGLTFEVTDVTPSEDQFGSQGPVFYTIKLDVVPTTTKSLKHADHDQSDHGSWATGESAETRNAAEKALTHYSIDGYHRINSYLRKIDSSQDELNTGDFDPEPVIKEIDSLFNSASPLKEPVTVFRGLDSEVAASITWAKGDIYTDSAFMSTSLSEAVSERFTGYGGTGSYMMQIEVPAGTTALTPSMFATLVDEEEVILNRGTTLQITGTEFKDNFNYIYATVVPATKSLKHADHDQSDHGNWATGGGTLSRNAERFKAAGGTIDKPVKATDSPRSDYAVATGLYGGGSGVRAVVWHWDDLVNKGVAADAARTKAEEANMNLWETTKLDIESPEYEKESERLQKAFDEADRLALGYKLTVNAITSTPFNEVIVARGADGSIVGSLAYYMPPDNSQFTVQLLGSTHEVAGTGTALMREAMSIALDKGVPFQVLDPIKDAQPWYESLGLGPLQMSDGDVYHEAKPLYRVEPDALREILGGSTKSLKHADHDQSDHGSWATGGSEHRYTGEPRSESSRADKSAYEDVYGDPERRENGRRAGSRSLGREVTHMEVVALESYKGGGYSEINRHLRGAQDGSDWTKDRVDAIKALAIPIKEPMTVTRMMPLFYGNTPLLEGIAAGQIYEDKGFMSTAKGEHPAQFFHGYPVQMQIELPAGTPVVDFDNWSGLDGWGNIEREVTLMPNSQLIIDRVEPRSWAPDFGEYQDDGLKIYARLVSSTKSLKHGDHDQEDHGNWARGSEFRSPSSEDRYRTPKGSATSTPYAAHYYDTQQRQRIDMALDAYTHWKPENSGDTDADRPFHEVLNENLRNGMNRGKAVEAASAEFATGDEKDDEATASDLYEGFMNLDSATQNSRMMEDTVVTRASSPIIYLDELEAAAAGGSLELYGFDISQGAVFSDAGFVSTSLDTTGQSTQYFASRWDTEGLDDKQIPTSVRWNITVPEGAPALDLRALEFASQHGEQEVILPRNTHFQVDSWDVQLPKFEGSPASVTINATVIPTHSTTKP